MADDPLYASIMAPIAPYLEADGISEICINGEGGLWVERSGGAAMEYHAIDELDEAHLKRMARLIAERTSQTINEQQPLLSAQLPGDIRVQIVLSSATECGTVFSFRKQILKQMNLDDYASVGAFRQTRFSHTHRPQNSDAILDKLAASGDSETFIREALQRRRNILISGGTSSGKTTFFNALLQDIPADERVITIEDAAELCPPHRNRVSLIASKGGQGVADVTTNSLLQSSLRLRPDRIMMGELRGEEAYSFLRAINTGHPGSMTTLHADAPDTALQQCALMIMQSGINWGFDAIMRYIHATIDIVIQLRRDGGTRYVSSIWMPPRHD